jgi:hypothetical protein
MKALHWAIEKSCLHRAAARRAMADGYQLLAELAVDDDNADAGGPHAE